jgi:hypothetical protein
MDIPDDEIEAANHRAHERKRKPPGVAAVRYDKLRCHIVITLSSGIELAFRSQDAEGLERATPDDSSLTPRLWTPRLCLKSWGGFWGRNEGRGPIAG